MPEPEGAALDAAAHAWGVPAWAMAWPLLAPLWSGRRVRAGGRGVGGRLGSALGLGLGRAMECSEKSAVEADEAGDEPRQRGRHGGRRRVDHGLGVVGRLHLLERCGERARNGGGGPAHREEDAPRLRRPDRQALAAQRGRHLRHLCGARPVRPPRTATRTGSGGTRASRVSTRRRPPGPGRSGLVRRGRRRDGALAGRRRAEVRVPAGRFGAACGSTTLAGCRGARRRRRRAPARAPTARAPPTPEPPRRGALACRVHLFTNRPPWFVC